MTQSWVQYIRIGILCLNWYWFQIMNGIEFFLHLSTCFALWDTIACAHSWKILCYLIWSFFCWQDAFHLVDLPMFIFQMDQHAMVGGIPLSAILFVALKFSSIAINKFLSTRIEYWSSDFAASDDVFLRLCLSESSCGFLAYKASIKTLPQVVQTNGGSFLCVTLHLLLSSVHKVLWCRIYNNETLPVTLLMQLLTFWRFNLVRFLCPCKSFWCFFN